MKFHPGLWERKFDRIIFNFPHAGFHGKEDNEDVILMHRTLVGEFFRNASSMLRANGEVHVSHKTTAPYCSWDLEELACRHSLTLNSCVPFKIEDYPGYNNKRGDSFRCDEPFPLGECSTFKFRVASYEGRFKRPGEPLRQRPIKIPKLQTSFEYLGRPCTNLNIDITEIWGLVERPLTMNIQRENPGSFDGCFGIVRETFPGAGNGVDYYAYEYLEFDGLRRPQANFTRNVNALPGYVGLPFRSDIQREGVRIFDGYFNNVTETLGGAGRNVEYSRHRQLFSDSERYMAERTSRTSNGYLYLVEELDRQRTLTSEELRRMMLLYLYGNP